MNNISKKNILVTGGAGFIGSHLIEKLNEMNHSGNVIILDSLKMGSIKNLPENLKKNFHLITLDLLDFSSVTQIIMKYSIDTVIHLATIPLVYSIFEPVVAFDGIVKMQQNLLECLRHGLYNKLIAFSTSEVYGGLPPNGEKYINELSPMLPATPYASAKAAADLLAISYYNSFSSNVTILRPFNNFGPRKNVMKNAGIIPSTIKSISQGEPVNLFGEGKTIRDFVYVKDTINAIFKIIENEANTKGEIIQIANGIPRTMYDIVMDIARLMNKEPIINYKEARQGDVQALLGSNEKSLRLLNFKPSYDWELGLKECIEYYS